MTITISPLMTFDLRWPQMTPDVLRLTVWPQPNKKKLKTKQSHKKGRKINSNSSMTMTPWPPMTHDEPSKTSNRPRPAERARAMTQRKAGMAVDTIFIPRYCLQLHSLVMSAAVGNTRRLARLFQEFFFLFFARCVLVWVPPLSFAFFYVFFVSLLLSYSYWYSYFSPSVSLV